MVPIHHPTFTAIVLAGSRASHDFVAEKSGVACKALAHINGTPMVIRVLEALQQAETISHRILCGPSWSIIEETPALHTRIDSKAIDWVAPQSSPSTSAASTLTSIPEETKVLLTTADHALLTRETIDFFCTESLASQSDVTVGLVPYSIVQEAFPQSKRTVMKFRDQGYCGCNLFAFLTPKGRAIATFWQQVEKERKRPIRLIRMLGWGAVLRYLTGRLSLHQGLAMLSKQLGMTISPVLLPFPRAAIDVDTVADLELVQRLAQEQASP
ncbi:MAG: nucleotidyltransferase family protein [Nitrospirales bacterium]|nr:nucleotidyltransferase family protein [Nitrospira sp.]MDR4503153.1 nucleotidyltransferase family protein [Nitrospirales bacterium]